MTGTLRVSRWKTRQNFTSGIGFARVFPPVFTRPLSTTVQHPHESKDSPLTRPKPGVAKP